MTSSLALSIILSNYNHGQYLGTAIDSIAEQALDSMELIIIDDGSTDDSLNVIETKSREHPFIHVLKNEKNMGSRLSVEKAFAEAKGEYVYFAASDDRVLPSFFRQSLDLLNKYPDANVCTGMVRSMSEQGEDLGPKPSQKVLKEPGYISPHMALSLLDTYDAWFICNTAIYRRQALIQMGGFDPDLNTFCDAFACTVMALDGGACFIPDHLASVRTSDTSQSALATTDSEMATEMFGHARQLMETRYAHLFPATYVKKWDMRWRNTVAGNIYKREGRNALPFSGRLVPDLNTVDYAIIRFLDLIDRKRSRLVPYFLLLRLTPFDFRTAFMNRFFHSSH